VGNTRKLKWMGRCGWGSWEGNGFCAHIQFIHHHHARIIHMIQHPLPQRTNAHHAGWMHRQVATDLAVRLDFVVDHLGAVPFWDYDFHVSSDNYYSPPATIRIPMTMGVFGPRVRFLLSLANCDRPPAPPAAPDHLPTTLASTTNVGTTLLVTDKAPARLHPIHYAYIIPEGQQRRVLQEAPKRKVGDSVEVIVEELGPPLGRRNALPEGILATTRPRHRILFREAGTEWCKCLRPQHCDLL
jgi:hypothetical protein